jgi:glucan phosphoethanolaminetransferase (alkaline phosphatase superfamily)
MSKRKLSILGMASGVFIIIAALLMGYFGFPHAGFGPRKIAIGLFGLLVLIVGIILFFWKQIRVGIIDSSNYSWTTLFGFTFCAAYLYVISEWIFIITKPSSLNTVTFLTKLGILFCVCALFSSLVFFVLSFFFVLNLIPWIRKFPKIFLALASLIPVSIITSLLLLLVDNFTYTVFKFGIVDSVGIVRVLYLTAFIILFIFIYVKSQNILSDISSMVERKKNRKLIVPVLIVFMISSFLLTYRNNSINPNLDIVKKPGENKYPNIVLITADGLDANHTSVYGYKRDTTPRLKDLANTSLVAENAFPNGSTTSSGLLSIYTSKDPTQTRVLYPPDILKNEDSYQHLPGILKSLGYYTAEFTHAHYADAYDENLLFGFDYANGRSIVDNSFFNLISNHFITDYSYFIYETSNRIIDRLEHIFFLKQMVNLESLIQGTAKTFNDQKKIDNIVKIFSEAKKPVFIYLHWMGTHGKLIKPKNQVFSAGKSVEDQGLWDDDFYDDSILEFDEGVGQIIDFLKSKDLFNNTIIIISSDHGRQWVTTSRIPLLIHYPFGQYSGIRNADIQQLDIAPTLLTYLGIEKPSWMEGDSFLQGELKNRPIFSAIVGNVEIEDKLIVSESMKPPFYQFGSIGVVYCNSWFTLNLGTNQVNTGLIEGHTQPCEDTVSNDQFMNWIIAHLQENGFDTSTIKP